MADLANNNLQSTLIKSESAKTIVEKSYLASFFGYVGAKAAQFLSSDWGSGQHLEHTQGGLYIDHQDPDDPEEIILATQVGQIVPDSTPGPAPAVGDIATPTDSSTAESSTKRKKHKTKKPIAVKRSEEALRVKHSELMTADSRNKQIRISIKNKYSTLAHPCSPEGNPLAVLWGNANPHTYYNNEGYLPPRNGSHYLENWPGGTAKGDKAGKKRKISGGGHPYIWFTDGGTHDGPSYWVIYASNRWWYWDITIADRGKRAREFDNLELDVHPDDMKLTFAEAEKLIELNEKGILLRNKKGEWKAKTEFKVPRCFMKTDAIVEAENAGCAWLGAKEASPPSF